MGFDDQTIDLVRGSVDLVDVVSGYVSLKKSGKDYAALCPFHAEKTPSFTVSGSKQIFKCFGCGAGGDVFRFIMLIEGVSFPESVELLAEKAGISLRQGQSSTPEQKKRQKLHALLEESRLFFQRRLEKENSPGRQYLRERGIDGETAEAFALGWAPAGNLLLRYLRGQGYPVELLVEAGLVKEGRQGQYYDTFRSRLIFPIRNLSGRTIAFGGRLVGEGTPKYLNSPETLLYRKSQNLYALDCTREEIRKKGFAILVEGYFDCIIPYQYGFRNVVASLGTSLTPAQVQILSRYTRQVAVCYDPDRAGVSASMRSIELFLEKGFRINLVELPKGDDPDSYLRREGAESFARRLKDSLPYMDYLLRRFSQEQPDPQSPRGKQEIVSRMIPYLLRISHRVERAEYVSRIAARVGVAEEALLAEMRQSRAAPSPGRAAPTPRPVVSITLVESILLRALLEEDYRDLVLEQLQGEMLEGLPSRPLFEAALAAAKRMGKISVLDLRGALSREEEVDLLERVALEENPVVLSPESVRGSLDTLRERQIQRLSQAIQEELQKAEREGSDPDRVVELLRKKERLRRRINLI